MAASCNFQIFITFLVICCLNLNLNLNLSFAHYSPAPAAVHDGGDDHHHHHHCDHGHDHHHHHGESHLVREKKLPEELAEEEDLRLLQFGSHHHEHEHEHEHDHHHGVLELSGVGLWVHAMGCSLLVSLASLVCLILLPFIFIKGKPSKAFVDALAVFGAGAMLGDAFLHQLPHAFGGEHSHSHDSHVDDPHQHVNLGNNHSHAHSLKDLSVGLSVLAGIVLFLLVEKIVRYVEHMSGGVNGSHGHHHHHHHHKKIENVVNDNDDHDNVQGLSPGEKDGSISEIPSEEQVKRVDDGLHVEKKSKAAVLRKRNVSTGAGENKSGLDKANGHSDESVVEKGPAQSSSSLVFGYLNLFSDGVHNFTDGMALGSAFLLHGSIGGWSRTLFLLAHELPQEIGDFGILVRSGFSVSKALFFNFLSALVALAGTALALLVGQNPGQSSLIEGFTAGGFIYIAVAGVLAEMNNGSSALRNTSIQLTALILGMGVALFISLVE